MTHSIKWDDLHYLLVVANQGSVSAAARELGVNHTTVLRHINAFEERQGLRLFERLPTGYKLTGQGARLLEAARSIEQTVTDLERKIAGEDLRLEGSLRVTTTDSLYLSIVGRHLGAFSKAYPGIAIDLTITTHLLSLTRRDADVAIRPAPTKPENLIATRTAQLGFGIYASPDFVAAYPSIGRGDWRRARWLGIDELLANSPPGRWLAETLPDADFVLRADSFLALRDAAERGMGLTLLPSPVGDTSGRLVRVAGPLPEIRTVVWILNHADLAGIPRVRAFTDYMSQALIADTALLEGREPAGGG